MEFLLLSYAVAAVGGDGVVAVVVVVVPSVVTKTRSCRLLLSGTRGHS